MNRFVFAPVPLMPRLITAAVGAAVSTAVGATWAVQAWAQAPATPAPATQAAQAAKPTAPSLALNPNPVPAPLMAHSCAACHGTLGQLGDESFKPLAGMPQGQFVNTMIDFREGRRPATLMGHVAKGFTDADLKAMGAFFAAQTPLGGSVVAKGAQ